MKYSAVMKRVDHNDIGRVLPFPIYRSGFDALAQVGEGEVRSVVMRKDRNPKLHRLFMKQIRVVVKNCPDIEYITEDGDTIIAPKWRSVDHLVAAVKKALGHYDLFQMLDGETVVVTRSISFEEMDDDEFKDKIFEPAQPLLSAESGIPIEKLQDPEFLKNY